MRTLPNMAARFNHSNYNIATTEQEKSELESAFATLDNPILVIQKATATSDTKETIASAYFRPQTPPGASSRSFSTFFGQASTRATLKEMVKSAGGRLVDPNNSCSRSQTTGSTSTTSIPTRVGTPVSDVEVREERQNQHVADHLQQPTNLLLETVDIQTDVAAQQVKKDTSPQSSRHAIVEHAENATEKTELVKKKKDDSCPCSVM